MTDDLAAIVPMDAMETEDLLAEKYVRSTLMGSLTAALKKVVDTNQSVFYAKPLTESQINNLRTTAQRHGMRISAHRVRRAGIDGHMIQSTTIGKETE